MLTSPRTNVTDGFIPGHHLALITQPVLGARSRSRKKANIIIETSTSSKEKLDSMTSTRRSSYNDSPPLILPINRVKLKFKQRTYAHNDHIFRLIHHNIKKKIILTVIMNLPIRDLIYPYRQIHLFNFNNIPSNISKIIVH